MTHLTRAAAAILLASSPVWLPAQSTPAADGSTRTIYVTTTDGRGGGVPGLAPEDFVVKEGGRERRVVRLEPAADPIRLTIAIEERLSVDSPTRLAVWQFIKRLAGRATFRLITIGLRNETLSEYTADPGALVNAINQLTRNPNRDSNVAEGILEIADGLARVRPRRPVVVVIAVSGGQSGVEPQSVLDRLRDSGATMYAVTVSGSESAAPLAALADQSGREQILGDGPKQSGGRRVDVRVTTAIPAAMDDVAADLLAQYALTYEVPAGARSETRLSVSLKRRGVTLRAPSWIPGGR